MVETSKKILCLLSTSEMNVSRIIQQTSSDRSHVVSVLRMLNKADIIEEIKDPKHKQKKIKKLTPLGEEYSGLMLNIKNFNAAYVNFDTCIKGNFIGDELMAVVPSWDQSDEAAGYPCVSSAKLRSRGWTNDEISKYDDWYVGAIDVLQWCHKNIILALVYQYGLINRRFALNEGARNLLNEIILEEFAHQISVVKRYTEDYITNQFTDPSQNNLSKNLYFFNIVQQVYDIYNHPSNLLSSRLIADKFLDLMAYVIRVGKPSIEVLEAYKDKRVDDKLLHQLLSKV